MAEVVQGSTRALTIERYLTSLADEWASIPVVAEEWPAWDELARLTFVLEWSMYEDRLAQLADWAEEGRLTAMQHERYRELLRLVARHRPTLTKLLAD